VTRTSCDRPRRRVPGAGRSSGQALLGAATAAGLQALLLRRPARSWQRTNHRGATVSLLSGPALAVAAGASADLPRAAALVASLGAGAVGAYDDRAGARHPRAKGFRGHAAALRRGEVTAGAVKVAGIGATGLLAAALAGERGRGLVLRGALVAGTANLANLLDLRPGRALKAGAAAGLALGQPGPAAACTALLPADLAERTMLGDGGANALGAVLGLALPRRPAVLAGVVALTAASEVVSYSRVIDAVPPLRWVDRLGRRP
jgi:UDP-GlcNAc:undecaprenyl-phosphate/decaprenyl-phosphate GlcNAc-1-phosphate transferase